MKIPFNTFKTVYLPTNPDVISIYTSHGSTDFTKADHIDYKRTIHNGKEFDYTLMSNTHKLYGLGSDQSSNESGNEQATEDISKTKNCAVILRKNYENTYIDVNDLELDKIGTAQEPGGISLFVYNDYANYDYERLRAMFETGFYFAGSFYFNILSEKFMSDMFEDSSNWYKFRVPFNNRFDTLVLDMNNFRDTERQNIVFRFEAPSREQSSNLAKFNTFHTLAVRNCDYASAIVIASRVSDTSLTSAKDAMPYTSTYGTLYNWALPPSKELKIDMVHPVRLSYIDTTPHYRTEITQLYLDARCVIKIKDSYVFIKKIYYTSEDKKPKFVSDLLTADELASYEAKCELLPFV
jgi:hypothetical protein